MIMLIATELAKACAIYLFAVFFLYWLQRRTRIPNGYKLPPGPQGHFLIGNLFDIPTKNQERVCREWPELYGDLTYLNIAGTSILFVNSYEMSVELFERRGGLYSDRFQSTMLVKLAGIDWHSGVMQPNERWRYQRSIFNRFLAKSSMEEYQGSVEIHAKDLLCRLYQSPGRFTDHNRHVVGSMIMDVTYGLKSLPENDPYMEVAEHLLKLLEDVASLGAVLVDFVPMTWAPGAGFKHKAKTLQAAFNEMMSVPFSAVKDGLRLGNAAPSIMRTILEELDPTKYSMTAEEEMNIQALGTVIYATAIDTTESGMLMFFFTMLLHPEAQKKAQEELDKVLGESTLPSMKDRKNLPYTEALCKEVLRWHPIAPLGFPHMLREDDIFGEYFIPKGTIVIGNGWALSKSTSIYGDDVESFRPERFLRPGAVFPELEFGFGRRICPGRHFADSLLFSLIAHILYMFDISPCDTPTGSDPPSAQPEDFDSGLISRPKPFKCEFKPRSEQKKALLKHLINVK